MPKTKNEIRRARLWRHFKSFIPERVYRSDLTEIIGYDPEQYQSAFFKYQTFGKNSITPEEVEGIKPLRDAQAAKELFLNSLVLESFEWDSKGWGWIHPFISVVESKTDRLDRLTLVAVLRIVRALKRCGGFGDRLSWFLRHPVSSIEHSQFEKLRRQHRTTYNY